MGIEGDARGEFRMSEWPGNRPGLGSLPGDGLLLCLGVESGGGLNVCEFLCSPGMAGKRLPVGFFSGGLTRAYSLSVSTSGERDFARSIASR